MKQQLVYDTETLSLVNSSDGRGVPEGRGEGVEVKERRSIMKNNTKVSTSS